MIYEYDFDNDTAQKFHSRSTMNFPKLKHDTETCKYCKFLNKPGCKHPEYNKEYDYCGNFRRNAA